MRGRVQHSDQMNPVCLSHLLYNKSANRQKKIIIQNSPQGPYNESLFSITPERSLYQMCVSDRQNGVFNRKYNVIDMCILYIHGCEQETLEL